MSHLLKKEYLYKLYGMCLHGLFVHFPPFIYLFNHLSISVGTKGYLKNFFSVIILYTTSFVLLCTWELYQLALWHNSFPVCVCLIHLSYFLTLQDAPRSSCIFSAPVSESATSPKNLGFFFFFFSFWVWHWKSKIF